MANKVILVLQGGGALGAYECGVYKALAPHFAQHGQALRAVAGTSIGAINACLIALRYEDKDLGRAALENFWMNELSTVSVPFFPTGGFEALNAVWTSLLFGNPGLYSPYVLGWNLIPPVFWGGATRFYDTEPMRKTLTGHFGARGNYEGTEPQLIVTAVDVKAGRPKVFNSGDGAGVTPADVMASCALPPWLPEQPAGDTWYWDGGLWSNTPLREALNALQGRGALGGPDEEYDVYIVDLFPREAELPRNNWEIWNRINQLTFADKSELDEKIAGLMNQYIGFVNEIHSDASALPDSSPLRRRIENERNKLADKQRVRLNVTRIARRALPQDATSREIDFSPPRIEELIAQGFQDASDELARSASPKGGAKLPTGRERSGGEQIIPALHEPPSRPHRRGARSP